MTQTPEELARKIKEAREREGLDGAPGDEPGDAPRDTGASGFRAATDLVGGVLAGLLLGYWLDKWLGTKPWMMIVFLFLGFGAGILNIIRAEQGRDFQVGFRDTTTKEEGKKE